MPTPATPEAATQESDQASVTDRVNEIMVGLGYERPKETEVAPVAPAAPEAAVVAPIEEKAKPKKKAAKPAAPEIDEDALAVRIADKLKPPLAPATPPAAPPPSKLTESDKSRRELLEVMAENKNYASLPAEYDAFIVARDRYIKDWQSKNSGGEFDQADPEHADFFDSHEPDFEEVDFHRAAGTLAARQEFDKRRTEESARAQRERVVETVQRQTTQEVETRAAELRAGTLAKLASIVGENTLLEEDGPIQRMQKRAERDLSVLISETNKLLSPDLGYKANPQIQEHQEIGAALQRSEESIANLNDAELSTLLKNGLGQKHHLAGKTFATLEDFIKLSPAQKARAWTLYTEPKLASALLAIEANNRLNSELEAIFKQVGSKTQKPAAQPIAPLPTQTDAAPGATSPLFQAPKTPSPSISSSADRVAPSESSSSHGTKFEDTVANALWQ